MYLAVAVPIAPAYLNLSAEADGAYTKLGVLFASNAGVQVCPSHCYHGDTDISMLVFNLLHLH